MDLQVVGLGVMVWIDLAQDRDNVECFCESVNEPFGLQKRREIS